MGDDQLVKQAQAGDAQAFGQLVDRHQPRIFGTLAKMTGDRYLAMDLTQDAFIRAWEQLGTFERRSAFSTWLYRIAVRLAYDAMRSRRRRDHRELDDRIADPDLGPDRRAEVAALSEDLRQRIEALPEMQRAIVILRVYDDLPYREIADILKTTENSARVSFHHAVTRLRDGYMKEAPPP